MDQQTFWRADELTNKQTDRRIDEQTDAPTDDRQPARPTDGRRSTGRQMDGQANQQTSEWR